MPAASASSTHRRWTELRHWASRVVARRAYRLEQRGRTGPARIAYAAALALDRDHSGARRHYHKLRPRPPGERRHLRFVALGTTGLCNASCLHCPTGKAATAHVPRTTMPMPLFERVVDEIVAEGWTVGSLHFGLFGDGLVDPLVVERARYARRRLPDVMLDINTNGAAFNPTKHAPLADLATLVTLHCESLRPATYGRLMAPLRLANVLPKYEAMLRTFPDRLRISVPVSRLNRDEVAEVRDWFMARGAREVVFDPLTSRCSTDPTLFRQLALAPIEIRCDTAIMDDVILDCDGMMLACCQDFERREPIGNAAADGLVAALADPRRRAFAERIAAGRHDAIATCAHCLGDNRTPDFPFDAAAA